jgi:aspartyl-tRNA(Asn)/glutamyl-tRNA(Gln) amidotransferase subunit C
VPDAITEQDVRRIARLARLELTSDEVRRFAAQLADILAYANQVQQVDTAAAPSPPASDASGQPLREDEVRTGLPRDEALANAPDANREEGFFKVPRVLG